MEELKNLCLKFDTENGEYLDPPWVGKSVYRYIINRIKEHQENEHKDSEMNWYERS